MNPNGGSESFPRSLQMFLYTRGMSLMQPIRFNLAAPALALVLPIAPVANAASFTNVTASAQINHVQHNLVSTGTFLDMTGGAAAGDVDGDGWVDLFVTRVDGSDILYRNLGNGTFDDISSTSGFTASLPTNGATFGDIDNDGDLDIYVTTTGHGRFYLYTNDGAGNFTEQGIARHAHVPSTAIGYGQSAAMGDYDRDGYLDIATGDWGNFAFISKSKLLKNMRSGVPGYFTDETVATSVDQNPTQNTFRFSPRFADMNNDGLPDLTFAADFLHSQLFWNDGDGTFTDGTQVAGVGTDQNGMGSTIADFDGDGDLDWFVTAIKAHPDDPDPIQDTGNRLYVNNGDGTFHDGTDAAGVRDVGWGWGTSFLDYDNDGDLDLIATNGWENGYLDNDPTTLWQNNGGVFTDVSTASGITDTDQGRGLLTLDYDNDGDLDVFIVNNGGQPILYENDASDTSDWLRIHTEGTESNRDGIGARITVDPDSTITGDEMTREIDGGSNFLSTSEMTAHFGLGAAAGSVDTVTIRWPSGIQQMFFNVAANTELLAVEAYLAGDLNGDGFVGIDDLNIVLGAWNWIVVEAWPFSDNRVSDLFTCTFSTYVPSSTVTVSPAVAASMADWMPSVLVVTNISPSTNRTRPEPPASNAPVISSSTAKKSGRSMPSCRQVLPTALTSDPLVLLTNSPRPVISRMLPPRSPAVPRSTEPPVTLIAAWSPPPVSVRVLLRRVRLPPATRTVASSVPVVNITPFWMMTLPAVTVRAGDPPLMMTPPPPPSRVMSLAMTTPL